MSNTNIKPFLYIYYAFEVSGLGGWILAETLPIIKQTTSVFLACYQQNLFDCLYNTWYWALSCSYSINTLKVLEGECDSLAFYILIKIIYCV